MLEPYALAGASYVTSVSEIQNAEMKSRYPWLDASRMAAIPIGGDPGDFAALNGSHVRLAGLKDRPDTIHLSYVGTFLPRAASLFRTLFRSFVHLRSTQPMVAKRIRFHFIGTSNQPNNLSTHRVHPIAEAEGVGDAVRETPERIPYLQALSWLAHSDGLLLLGSDEPHYTASKIYPALMSGRPFVSLFHRASSAHNILSSAGGGSTLSFETPQELDALVIPLAEALRTVVVEPERLGKADSVAYAPYTAEAVTRRFAGIFDKLVTEPPN
jgi:hypothetical protein